MPLPAAVVFLGLLGGRELVRRKGVTRKDDAQIDALEALSGGGQLGFNGMGPPTPVGTGQTQLNDVQIATTQAMSLGDPGAALAQALAFAEQNRLQGNFVTQVGLQSAGLDLQKSTFELGVERQELARDTFELGKLTTGTALAEANRALVDPAFAEARAAKAGASFFNVQDQQTGAFEQIPLRGTAGFNAVVEDLSDTTGLLANINRLRTLNTQVGGVRDPANPAVRELQSLHTAILLQLKEAFELGALTGPDIGLVLARFPDPTAASNILTSTPEALDQAFSSVSRSITDDLTNKLNGVRNFRGIDQRVIGAAAQSIFGARSKDAGAFQRQTSRLAVQAGQMGAERATATSGSRLLTEFVGMDPGSADTLASLGRQAGQQILDAPLAIATALSGLPILGRLFR